MFTSHGPKCELGSGWRSYRSRRVAGLAEIAASRVIINMPCGGQRSCRGSWCCASLLNSLMRIITTDHMSHESCMCSTSTSAYVRLNTEVSAPLRHLLLPLPLPLTRLAGPPHRVVHRREDVDMHRPSIIRNGMDGAARAGDMRRRERVRCAGARRGRMVRLHRMGP